VQIPFSARVTEISYLTRRRAGLPAWLLAGPRMAPVVSDTA